jgi:outer membrane lipoprotein-sorting protein
MKSLSPRYSATGWPNGRFALALVALLGPIVGPAFGQSPPDIGAIVQGISKAYKNPMAYDIVETATMQLGAVNGMGIVRSKTRLVSQHPDKFRLEIDNSIEMNGVLGGPGDAFPSMVIIGDATEVWEVSPDFKQYAKTTPSHLATIRAWVKAAESGIFDVPNGLEKEMGNLTFLREESVALEGNNIDCFVIKLVLSDHPESTTLWVEKTRFLIRRIRVEEGPSADTQGQTVSITNDFPVVNIGVALPAGTFTFTPPPSATEVDKTTP